EALDALQHRLKHMNPRAPQHTVHFGNVAIKDFFDLRGFNLNAKLDIDPDFLSADTHDHDHSHGHDHGHDHGRDHDHGLDVNRHDAHIRAFCVIRDEPLDWERFCAWIDMLTTTQGPDLLRIKGLLSVAGEAQPVAIHGVQHLFHPPVLLPSWPSDDRRSKLV
ncbi:GTP-binding protein, partial [bacterium]|nr:GTP-binding protein [bacterium]